MVSENARQDEAKPQRENGKLVEEYRKVGPAAINAALLCKSKPKTQEPKRSYEPHEEI